eukprot:1383027-Amphidinium_carterae.2
MNFVPGRRKTLLQCVMRSCFNAVRTNCPSNVSTGLGCALASLPAEHCALGRTRARACPPISST